MAGAAVLGTATTSESAAPPTAPAPFLPDTTSPRTVTFPPGATTSGTDIPRQVGEAGRLFSGAKRRAIDVFWQVDTDRQLIALTSDDGPIPGVSNVLYDVLDESRTPATFFLVGRRVVQNAAMLTGRMGRHEVGNHSYNHESPFNKTDSEMLQDLTTTHRAILRATGKEPRLFRPPYSHVSGSTLVSSAFMGYDVVLSSGVIGEAGDGERLVADVVATVAPGAIVRGRDGGPEYLTSIGAIPAIVRDLRAQGYEFVTVSQLREAAGL